MQETLLGPRSYENLADDYPDGTDPSAFPQFKIESESLDSARKTLTIDTLMQFTLFEPNTRSCDLSENVTVTQKVVKSTGGQTEYSVCVQDSVKNLQVTVPANCTFSRVRKRHMDDMYVGL